MSNLDPSKICHAGFTFILFKTCCLQPCFPNYTKYDIQSHMVSYVTMVTCDEILSWMIEIQMKNHLVNDCNCNTINLQSTQKIQGFTNNAGLKFSVGDTILRFTVSIDHTTILVYLQQILLWIIFQLVCVTIRSYVVQ